MPSSTAAFSIPLEDQEISYRHPSNLVLPPVNPKPAPAPPLPVPPELQKISYRNPGNLVLPPVEPKPVSAPSLTPPLELQKLSYQLPSNLVLPPVEPKPITAPFLSPPLNLHPVPHSSMLATPVDEPQHQVPTAPPLPKEPTKTKTAAERSHAVLATNTCMGETAADEDDNQANYPLSSRVSEDDQLLHTGNSEDGEDDYTELVEALESFGYGILSCLTNSEAISLALFITKVQNTTPRHGYQDYQELLNALLASHTLDIRTVHSLLERKTGIKHIRYQVCEKGCYCFAKTPQATSCPVCTTPRPQKFMKTFDCIDLIHLLRLHYSHRTTAEGFQDYRESLRVDGNDGHHIRDFWDGKLFKHLHRLGMFLDGRDIAFLCSSDGVNLFRKGNYPHYSFPFK